MTDVSAEKIAELLALKKKQQEQFAELLAEEKKLIAARLSNIDKKVRNDRLKFGALFIGGASALTASVLGVRTWLSRAKETPSTLASINSIDPLNNPTAFVDAVNTAAQPVQKGAIPVLKSAIETTRNLAADFTDMAQSPSLFGTAGKAIDTRFIEQLQNLGGSAAYEGGSTHVAPFLKMFQNPENMAHFEQLAAKNPDLLDSLKNLPNDSTALKNLVSELADLEYHRLEVLSKVDFRQVFDHAFTEHKAKDMHAAIAQLKGTFQYYGEKFTEQAQKLQQTLTKISSQSSTAPNGEVLVASTDLRQLGISFPSTPTPPNGLQQAFSAVQDTLHNTLSTVGNTLGNAAKATGQFVQENAGALTAASAAVTLVRGFVETTQKDLVPDASLKQRAVAALTTEVSGQDYIKTLTKLPYLLGLARTAAMAAVAITPAAMGVAATIGAIQGGQAAAGLTAAVTKHQLSKTEQRLAALQQQEGNQQPALEKLTAQQERLQNRAAYFQNIAKAERISDIQAIGAKTRENIATVANTAGQQISSTKDAVFTQALKVTECVQQATGSVQNFFNNFAARFSKTAEQA
jgi:hypothetical protein